MQRLAALALPGLLAVPPVFAARPFVTEDADIIKRGACELEVVHAEQRAPAAEAEGTTSAQLACGVGLSTELSLAGLRTTLG